MSIEEIKTDIQKRLDSAQAAYKLQRESESPNVRAMESAWGKLVAYDHCLRLIKQLKI